MINESKTDNLTVRIYEDRLAMGRGAAQDVALALRNLLSQRATVNMLFAAAPSQNEFLAALCGEPGLAWERVNAFHMDEYVGLPTEAPQGFGNFLKERIFGKLPFKSVHYLNGNAEDLPMECMRYSALLREFPLDIVCMGIGENAHIAFNDPHVADFADPHWVKVVDLDQECRQQQVNDGCFSQIAKVPTHALTLTVPALMQGRSLFCMVPGPNKARAAYNTLNQPISEQYPSTILRRHENAILYLDKDSASLL